MRGVAQDRLLALLVTVASVALVSPIVVAMQPPSVKKLSLSNNNNNNNNQQQKQQQQKQQLRLKPQPSSSSSSGLPVPDLLESPDTKYDPKAKDIDNDALRLRLKDHFDAEFMSIGQPKEALLYPNGTAEYPLRYNNNLSKHLRPKWNLGSLQLPDGTKLRSRLARKARKKLEQFLWLYTQCPVIYRWKDLGPRYWPRWVKQGRCQANQSCSFPPGMSCRAGQERDVVILRWHCQRWDPPRFCKWIFMHYPIVTQCQCACSNARASNSAD